MSDTSVIPTGTTLIDVRLKNPNGHPLANTRFIVKPVRAGFTPAYVGVVEDKEELYSTDENGYVQLHLWPLPYPYMLIYSYADDVVPGYFLFYVPAVDTVVDFQDLAVTMANPDTPYGDQVLSQIVAAKAEVSALVVQAKSSEDKAALSASKAADFSAASMLSAAQALEDRNQVAAIQQALQNTLNQISEAVVKIQAINIQSRLVLGNYHLWVDSTGKFRIKDGAPSSDTDGTVVGNQSE